MNEMNCDEILMAKMAEFNGEEINVSVKDMDLHFAACENCRREIEQMLDMNNLLDRQTRLEQDADLWPVIEKRITRETASPIGWKPFALLATLLVIYRLLEMLPERDLGMALKLVPLFLIVGLFLGLKENPFKINTELVPER
ncbi:MAG: hypothetical protein ABIV48_13695 [Pyrinomonadaceae bacterium]